MFKRVALFMTHPPLDGITAMIGCLVRRTAGFALIWWGAAEGSLAAWPLAVLAVAAAVIVSLRLLPPGRFSPPPITALTGFAYFFIRQSFRGGVQVSRLAFQRRPRLHPAVLAVPLTLPQGLPRMLLTGTLGLMPGTLGVRLELDLLHLHVLDRGMPITEEVEQLAAHIARLFGVPHVRP